ncbi:MAG TPA: hypothetical protein PLZ08_03090 [Bacillota bacterium]|jgi:hypothetical protein|nr:hypothetical protein [Bacillota bacterium]HOL09262.1 hypothetical protein [Bacillota bacterium]HPO96925.1 hypothetical protein [Bacillota bacterium]
MFKLRTSLTLILLVLFGFSISIQGKNKEEEGLKNKAIWKVKLGQIYQFYSEDQFITRRGSKFELF